MKKVGIFVTIVGIGIIILTSFSSFTKVKVVDIKQVEASRSKPLSLNWHPLIGVGLLGIGALVLQFSSEKS